MDKVHLSITIDAHIIKKLGKQKSQIINQILNEYFSSDKRINSQIEKHELKIKVLKQIKEENKKRKTVDSDSLRNKIIEAKRIIEDGYNEGRKEELMGVWKDVINKEFNKNFGLDEFKELIRITEDNLPKDDEDEEDGGDDDYE